MTKEFELEIIEHKYGEHIGSDCGDSAYLSAAIKNILDNLKEGQGILINIKDDGPD